MKQIEIEIENFLSTLEGKTPLHAPSEYALKSGGKRLRPFFVYSIGEALGNKFDLSSAALSVELFHTASLIADDLPCMDNDDERREKPSLHKVFGEGKALLTSYGLITAAFEKIYEGAVGREEGEKICLTALECASKNAGIFGATGGQYLDLFSEVNSFEEVCQVIHQKTVTLFEVSFVFGWIFGGGDLSLLPQVKKASYHLGLAFQLRDDILDLSQDDKKNFNAVTYLGLEATKELIEKELTSFESLLKEIHLLTPVFQSVIQRLRSFDS